MNSARVFRDHAHYAIPDIAGGDQGVDGLPVRNGGLERSGVAAVNGLQLELEPHRWRRQRRSGGAAFDTSARSQGRSNRRLCGRPCASRCDTGGRVRADPPASRRPFGRKCDGGHRDRVSPRSLHTSPQSGRPPVAVVAASRRFSGNADIHVDVLSGPTVCVRGPAARGIGRRGLAHQLLRSARRAWG